MTRRQEVLAALEEEFEGVTAQTVRQDHHRARLAREFRDEQERQWAKNSNFRAVKRNHKSKRGFRR